MAKSRGTRFHNSLIALLLLRVWSSLPAVPAFVLGRARVGERIILPSGRIRKDKIDSQSVQPFISARFATTGSPDLTSKDPFRVLGIEPTADKKEIKRAYKKLALRYHPDVVSKDVDKRTASDRFAKINWAYETLSGKNGGRGSGSSTGSSSYSSTASSAWTPPHRRTSGSSPSSSSNDWRDFMPKYEDEDYDTDGDSFGAIFSDLITGIGTSSGGSGIFRDFVEFLENNFDGYSSGGASSDDARLRVLLQTGSVDDVGDEMDETDLVVQQLSTKLRQIDDELVTKTADLNLVSRFSERIELEETIQELQARKKVVDDYLKRAKKRLLALQNRYKELIVAGRNDSRAGGRRSSGTEAKDTRRASEDTTSPRTATAGNSSAGTARTSSTENNTDTFGSFGRGSSRGRRRTESRSENTTASRRSSSTYGQQRPSSPSSPSSTSTTSDLPPHRRAPGTYTSKEEDRRRLRDLKVDEEFEKLKRDLGL